MKYIMILCEICTIESGIFSPSFSFNVKTRLFRLDAINKPLFNTFVESERFEYIEKKWGGESFVFYSGKVEEILL